MLLILSAISGVIFGGLIGALLFTKSLKSQNKKLQSQLDQSHKVGSELQKSIKRATKNHIHKFLLKDGKTLFITWDDKGLQMTRTYE